LTLPVLKGQFKQYYYNIIIIIIIIITIAQQPYMGSGLLLPPLFEVTKSCAFVADGDWSTGRATVSIDPDEPARVIWQAIWLIHARKVLLHAVNLHYFPSEGGGAPDFYHP
jgi:hypothetical protein